MFFCCWCDVKNLYIFIFTDIGKELDTKLEQLKVINQKLHRNSRRSSIPNDGPLIRRSSSQSDQPMEIAQVTNTGSKSLTFHTMVTIVFLVFTFTRLTQ